MNDADMPPSQRQPDRPMAGRGAAAGLLLALLAMSVWALFVRASNIGEPFSFTGWTDFEWLNPYYLGLGLQEILAPLALVYALSRLHLLHRQVTGRAAERDRWLLLAALLGIQLLVFLIRLGLARTTNEQVTFDFLIAFTAGLLGGWRLGLAVGLLTTFTTGLNDYLFWNEAVFSISDYFEYAVLKNLDAMTAVFVGSAAGFAGTLLGRRRFHPGITAIVAVPLVGGAVLFMLYAAGYPPFYLGRLLPNLFIFGLAAAAVALMMRNVQNVETQRQAEAAELALAQANLNLAQARLALTQAELRALHAQINPHFFFNTLNTIRYFIRTDPEQARRLLINLSDIFQRALSAGEFVSLQDEIHYVEAYLALEKARLDDRLQIIWTNLARDLLEMPVPTLVLQPLVENSVIHGISRQPEGGTIHIILNRLGNELLVQLDDNGPGFEPARVLGNGRQTAVDPPLPAPERSSIGLRNVDERLRMLYGDEYGLQIDSAPGQGTRIVFRVPLAPPNESEPAAGAAQGA